MTYDDVLELFCKADVISNMVNDTAAAYIEFVELDDGLEAYGRYRDACNEIIGIIGDELDNPDYVRFAVMNRAIKRMRDENGL